MQRTHNHTQLGDKINFLVRPFGHIEASETDLRFAYSGQVSASRCGLAETIGELRDMANCLRMGADIIAGGTVQPVIGDESHHLILSRLPLPEICERIESALGEECFAFPVGEGFDAKIDLAFGFTRETDGTRESVAEALRSVASELEHAAKRLAG